MIQLKEVRNTTYLPVIFRMVGDTSGGRVSFDVDAEGHATLTGASLTVDSNGNATLTGATLAVDQEGNALVA